jgi:hypothetical protein
MAKAQITTRSGTQVTIEGDAAEVARIVSQVDQTPYRRHTKGASTRTANTGKSGRKSLSISELVIGLKHERFFDKPKNLSEIAAELEKSGYLYPTTTLSGIVLSLVKRKELTRARREAKWVYGRR